MSIKKWLNDEKIGEDWKKREEEYNKLNKKEKIELKKKKIKQIVQKDVKKQSETTKKDEFLNEILKFKEWLNKRNYLKGDLDKIETWIKNLHTKLEIEIKSVPNSSYKIEITRLRQKYKSIPPTFLDEKTRIAINKKLRNVSRTTSDNYYLRKLKETIKEKLKEAEYYEILRNIMES